MERLRPIPRIHLRTPFIRTGHKTAIDRNTGHSALPDRRPPCIPPTRPPLPARALSHRRLDHRQPGSRRAASPGYLPPSLAQHPRLQPRPPPPTVAHTHPSAPGHVRLPGLGALHRLGVRPEHAAPDPSSAPTCQTLYEHRAMRRAFAGLQPDHRNVLVLRYFADLQGTDLVLALDTPEDQVESLRRQALSQLCQRLKVAAVHNPKAVAPLVASNRALTQALRNHLTATASALNVPPNLWDIPTSPVARPSRLDRLRHKLRTAAMRCGIPVSAATVTSPRRRPPPHS